MLVGALTAGTVADRIGRKKRGDCGFTAFALAGVSSMVFIGIAALRSTKPAGRPQQRAGGTGHRTLTRTTCAGRLPGGRPGHRGRGGTAVAVSSQLSAVLCRPGRTLDQMRGRRHRPRLKT
ncbi:hypothetical protein [Streptomyces sp. HUAS ZL42]|uniref:hypothetical protein n=1 Tax=Streptomyces sp. HUAS ZL42 TaxID=3231715 RepID=UPI00345E90C0